MPWKVLKVNNGSSRYVVQRHCGRTVDVAIPPEHKSEIAGKAYVAAICDAHDLVLNKDKKIDYLKLLISFVSGGGIVQILNYLYLR